jgi:hypothetical protein
MNQESFDLTSYIKKELDRKDVRLTKRDCYRRECLKNIGKAFNQYLSYENLLKDMDDRSIKELKNAISRVQFDRKSFTEFISCSREEADKEAINLRSKGYFTYGEFGGEYGYFQHKKELTEEQKEWFDEHKECCYYHGQPCYVWQKEEHDDWDEDCECHLGREYSTLCIYELDEDEEKRLGIWKQEITWTLNGYGGEYQDCYYSLEQLKKDALEDLNEIHDTLRKKILSYNGKEDLNEGNINIKVKKNSESSDDE